VDSSDISELALDFADITNKGINEIAIILIIAIETIISIRVNPFLHFKNLFIPIAPD